LWLRALVLGGVGLLLALPAILTAASMVWHRDRAAVVAVTQSFLDALHNDDKQALQPLLAARSGLAADANPDLNLPGTLQLRHPFLRARIDGALVQGNNATVSYTLQIEEEPVRVTLPGGRPGLDVKLTVRADEPLADMPVGPFDTGAVRLQVQAAQQLARKMAGQKGSLSLHRTDGRWLVTGTTFPADEHGQGPSLVWGQEVVPSEDSEAFRAFKELAAVGPDRGESVWRVDLDLKDVPARNVIQEQARGLGLQLVVPPALPALSRPVSLRLRGGSRLMAIEDVCRQAGLQMRYGPGALSVSAGRRAGTPAFAGPFLVEAVEVKEFPPNATAALRLRCVAGRPIVPSAGLLGPEAVRWRIDAVTAADGRDLYHAANQPYYNGSANRPFASLFVNQGQRRAGLYEGGWVVPLRNLLRDLDTVSLVRGRLVVALPARVDEVRFDRLALGVTGQEGDVRLTIRRADLGVPAGGPPGTAAAPRVGTSAEAAGPVRALVELDAAGMEGKRLLFAAHDGLGRLLRCGTADVPRPDLARIEVTGDPAALVCKVVSLQEVEYPFELRDVPLTRTPQRLEPARFPGHECPVSVEFLAIVRPGEPSTNQQLFLPRKFPAVRLQLRNHCQKNVEKVRLKLTYLDAAGQPVGEGEKTAATFNELENKLRVIEPGTPFEVEDDGLPAGAVKAAVSVTAVGFADGTAWPP
jgi:hypothetical protein